MPQTLLSLNEQSARIFVSFRDQVLPPSSRYRGCCSHCNAANGNPGRDVRCAQAHGITQEAQVTASTGRAIDEYDRENKDTALSRTGQRETADNHPPRPVRGEVMQGSLVQLMRGNRYSNALEPHVLALGHRLQAESANLHRRI